MKNISKLGLALSIAAAAVTGLATAQEAAPAKEQPPVGSEPKGFSLPKIETYSLRNGVDVTLVPYGRVPKATVRAVVRVGNLNDGEQTWIADLTAEMMKKGAGGKSASELAQLAAGMGGDLNIGVGLDQTFAVMDVLSESAPDAVSLLADVLQRPNLPETELQKVKDDLIRNVSIARTQPGALANEAFAAALYPDHPYGDTLPDDGQLEAYTLDGVKTFHEANFGGQRTHLYVVGGFNRRAVKRQIRKSFGKWEEGPAPLLLTSAANEETTVALIDRPGAPQSTIRLGKRVPPISTDLDLAAADTLLGGYFSSRITRNIREDKGYTYSPRSILANRVDASNWQQNADVTSEATGASLTEIMKEIRLLQDEAPSQKEIDGIKNYMNGIFVIRLASRGGMANQLSFVDLHDLGTEYLEGYVDEVQSLSAGDLQNAAKTHLQIDDMSLVVVGPLDTVRGQLEGLEEFAGRLPPTAE
ncbi:MAG: pitrilysin family protein [Pseudomonadota bacterium]